MNTKITVKRLLNVINYEWVLATVISIVAVMAWSILYTSLATRLTEGQQFFLVTYENVYSSSNDVGDKFLRSVANVGKDEKKGFSYDVYEMTHNNIRTTGNYSASYMLELRLSVYEGDVLVIGGGDVEYKEDDESTFTDLLSLVSSGRLLTMDSLLKGAYDYTVGNGFITETENGYMVNEAEIEQFFRTYRIKSSRHYRRTYNTEDKIKDGVKKEIERIEILYNNYSVVKGAIEKAKEEDKDFLWYATPTQIDNGTVYYGERAAFGIDLNLLTGGSIKDLWFTTDENGNNTSDGLIMAVFDFRSVQSDLQYESLAVFEYIIRNYSDYAI